MNLRKARKQIGYSQAELADRMGVTPNTVSRWETGRMLMSGPAVKLVELMLKLRHLINDNEQQDDEDCKQ